MSEFHFITFTDVHISNTNPASRLGSYRDDIFNKLEQIKKVGEKLNIKFFLFAGDLFNLKAPMRNPHELNTLLINLFKSYPSEIYAIEGNHDLRNDSYETFSQQPLNVIYASGALKRPREEHIIVEGTKIFLHGYNFEEEPDISEMVKAPENVDLSICMLHLYSSMEGGSLYKRKVFSYEELSELGYDIYLLGHYHIDQGIEDCSFIGKKQTFINIGAVSRGVLDEDNIKRSPKIGFITVKKEDKKVSWKAQCIKLKTRPAEEIFDIEKKEEEKKKLKEAEEFVDRLKNDIEINKNQKDSIISEVNKLDIEKAVLDKIIHYINEADLSLKEISS